MVFFALACWVTYLAIGFHKWSRTYHGQRVMKELSASFIHAEPGKER